MSFEVRPAVLQDGVAVLSLLEDVGYYPEPVSFAQTFRRTISDPHFLVRVADADGRIVGVATLALRYQLGLGGLVASLDELAVDKDAPRGVERALRRETLGRARALGAVRVFKEANRNTPPPRAAQLRARAAAESAHALPLPA
jgi:acetyltransferase (GNAT) family protein